MAHTTHPEYWVLVGIAGVAAAISCILAFLFGPKFFEFFE